MRQSLRFLLLSILLVTPGFAQLLVEDFNYTIATAITANGWSAFSGAGTNAIKVAAATGLTYAGYLESGNGNCVSLTTSGEDDSKTLSSAVTSGSVYCAFLVTASAAQTTGDYFFSLYSSNGYFGRVFIKSTTGGYYFGLSKNTTSPTYESTVRALGTTYLVVVKYTINAGTNDDQAYLFVNPVLGGAEPSATIGPITDANNDPASISMIALRQGTAANAPTLKINGIRVATDWATAAASSNVSVNSITNGIAASPLGSGTTNQALLGFSMTGPVGSPSFTAVNINFTTDPSARFTNAKLVQNTTNNYSTGTKTTIANGTITSTKFQFSGFVPAQTLSSTAAYYFVVADVKGSVDGSTPASQPSVSNADITVSGASINSTTITGTSYSFSASPLIILTSSLNSFSQYGPNPSATQSYTVSGAHLTANIILTPPVGFDISTDNGVSWTINPSTLTIPNSGGSASATVLIRMNASPTGTSSGTISHSSIGSNNPTLAVTGVRTNYFYPKTSSDLSLNTNWGFNTDGSGSNPPDFASDYQVFLINKSNTISQNWTVSGSNSKIIVGNGASQAVFTIPDPFTVTGTVDIAALGTLSVASNTAPAHTYGTINNAGTIEFAQSGSYNVPQAITYGNLKLTNGTKTLAGYATTVQGNLTLTNTTLNAPSAFPFSTINLGGDLTYVGTVTPPADVSSIALVATGSGTQTITGNGNTVRWLSLTTNNAGQYLVLASNALDDQTDLLLGNMTGGGLTLSNASSSLTLNNNTLTFFSGKPIITGSGTISGSANSSIVTNNDATATSYIGYLKFTSGSEYLKNLTVNLASTTPADAILKLGSALTVYGNLTITAGNLNLNGYNLTLGPNATLSESEGNSIYGTSGTISTTRTFNAGDLSAGVNIANLGLNIKTDATLETTTITRGHAAQTGNGHAGITRYYIVHPTIANQNINGTFVFSYFNTELNSIAATDLGMFESADGGASWPYGGQGTVDAVNKTVTMTVNDILTDGSGNSYFTLGDVNNPLPVELKSFTTTVNEHVVRLSWNTATEINMNSFEVERSTANSGSWKNVGYVKAAGNSNSLKSYSFIEPAVANGTYSYRLKLVDNDGTYKYSAESKVVVNTPNTFELSQNYPNPFNPSTMLSYNLAMDAKVVLKVYNALGTEVATVVNELQSAGPHAVSFSADQYHLASGIYFYKLQAGNFSQTRRMMLLK